MIATIIFFTGWSLIAPSFFDWLFRDKPIKKDTGTVYYDDNHQPQWKKDP